VDIPQIHKKAVDQHQELIIVKNLRITLIQINAKNAIQIISQIHKKTVEQHQELIIVKNLKHSLIQINAKNVIQDIP